MEQSQLSRFSGIFCAFFLFLAQSAIAQTTPTLSIQGVIKGADGTAVDNGKYAITFKLYTVETGGTSIWDETQPKVTVTGGVYSTRLGTVTPLSVPFDVPYFLGITVESGIELTPRVPLTSSPYALSLRGTGNSFPSAGPIGAGTNSPTAGYQLHVKNSAGDSKILVDGSGNAVIELKKGPNSAQINFDGSQINLPGSVAVGTLTPTTFNFTPTDWTVTNQVTAANAVVSGNVKVGSTSGAHAILYQNQLAAKNGANSTDLYLNFDNSGAGKVDLNNGKLVVDPGTNLTTVTTQLKVTGTNDIGFGGNYFDAGSSSIKFSGGFTGAFSIDAAARVKSANGFFASSDRRIKKDIRTSEAVADLDLLTKLRVADYRHIDRASYGDGFKKGFIAQEVAETFPEAVVKSPDFVPSVYATSTGFELSAGLLTITLDKNHDFRTGDEVRLIFPDGQKELAVAATPSAQTFSVKWTGAKPANVFVFGKKVADFHTVDYDRIFTLNVSATQELARQVEFLKKELADEQAKNAALRSENGQMKASVDKFDARLRVLENKLSN